MNVNDIMDAFQGTTVSNQDNEPFREEILKGRVRTEKATPTPDRQVPWLGNHCT